MELDPDTIHVESTVSATNTKPYVLIKWGESIGTLSVPDARRRAIALIQACAIAETEATVFKLFVPEAKSFKGFGESSKKEYQTASHHKNETKAVELLRYLRTKRPYLPPDIEPIFGAKTQKPLINYSWDKQNAQMEMHTAQHHATAILEAAEAAETDSFFYRFFESEIDIPKDQVQGLLGKFATFRQQNELEDLLK